MIRSRLFFCCESSAIDARTNTVSAFNIAEQLNSPSFPVVIPRLSIIVLLSREQADASVVQLQLQIFAGAQQLFFGPLEVNFIQQLATRTVAEINGLLVPGPLELRFLLKNGEEMLDSWTISIQQVGQPAQLTLIPPPAPPFQPAN